MYVNYTLYIEHITGPTVLPPPLFLVSVVNSVFIFTYSKHGTEVTFVKISC
jgi:hypothetical protein